MKKIVRIVESFEAADEANLLDRRSLTPEERVEIFLALQQRGFVNGTDERLVRVCRVLTLEES